VQFEEYKDRQNKIDMENNMLKVNNQNKFEDYMNNVVATVGNREEG
jgi:hypothetical protein